MLVLFQQSADFRFRRVEIDMLDIVARRHDATYGALVEIQHPLNHPALLRIKNLAVVMVCQHRGGFRIQFGILFFTANQPHHGLRCALAQRMVSGKKTAAVKNSQLVERLDHHREADSRIQIPFRNVETKPFRHQAKADH